MLFLSPKINKMSYIQRILIFGLILFYSCNSKREPSMLIGGSLGNLKDEYITWSTFNSVPDTIDLEGRNSFVLAPRRYRPQYITLQIKKHNFEIYVGPELHLEIETVWKESTPTLVFDGNAAKINKFLQQKIELESHETLSGAYLRRYSPDEFDEASLKVYNLMHSKLAKLHSEDYPAFYRDQQLALDCWHTARKLNYLMLNFPTTPDKHRDINITKALLGVGDCYIELREYRELLWAYFRFIKQRAIKENSLIDNRQLNKLQMEIIGDLKMNGESKNYFLEKLLDLIWISNPTEADDVMQFYKTHCTRPRIINKVLEKTKKLTAIQAGTEAPEFLARDVRDNFVALSDYRGRYVYVFFWSDDSEQCQDEFRAWNQLVSRYGYRNIKFLAYSFDPNDFRWKQAIKSSGLKGEHIHGDFKTSGVILDQYQVLTTPRFILIDPDGKLISPFALKPSENVASKIDDLLF